MLAAIFALTGSLAFAADADKGKNSKESQKTEKQSKPDKDKKNRPEMPMFEERGMFFGMGGHHHMRMHEGCPMHGMDMEKPDKKDKYSKKDKRKDFDKKDRKGMKGKRGFFPGFPGGWGKEGRDMKKEFGMPEADVMSLVNSYDSAFAKHLEEMKKDSPRQYGRIMKNLSMRLFFFKDNKNDDKAKTIISKAIASEKAQAEVSDLLSKYRKANKDEKAAFKKELKTSLEKLFDIKIQEQQDRIKGMEEAIADQKKKLEDRKKSKNSIVDTRLDEITGEKFQW